jgi:hypothetical protein
MEAVTILNCYQIFFHIRARKSMYSLSCVPTDLDAMRYNGTEVQYAIMTRHAIASNSTMHPPVMRCTNDRLQIRRIVMEWQNRGTTFFRNGIQLFGS